MKAILTIFFSFICYKIVYSLQMDRRCHFGLFLSFGYQEEYKKAMYFMEA